MDDVRPDLVKEPTVYRGQVGQVKSVPQSQIWKTITIEPDHSDAIDRVTLYEILLPRLPRKGRRDDDRLMAECQKFAR